MDLKHFWIAAALFAATIPATATRADDTAKPPAAEAAAKDPFAVPEGSDAEQLNEFLTGLVQNFQQRGAEYQSEEGTVKYLNKMDEALTKVLAKEKIDEQPAVLAASIRMQVLQVLRQLGQEDAVKRMDDMVVSLKKSEIDALKQLGQQMESAAKLSKLPTMEAAERDEFINQLAEALKGDELTRESVAMANQAADILADAGNSEEAAQALELFAKTLEGRSEDRLVELVERMRGTARRYGLLGNEIEIKGTTIEGKKFDIQDWKGKVVLVDFWATWCGPCIAELPNVKRNYELYHDRGFEIVGISLDNSPEDLTEFIKEEGIPWVTLFPEKEEERGWENPIARHYGISGIPTVILVDQEGKVINLNARGPALGMELAKLLGPAEEQAEGSATSGN